MEVQPGADPAFDHRGYVTTDPDCAQKQQIDFFSQWYRYLQVVPGLRVLIVLSRHRSGGEEDET